MTPIYTEHDKEIAHKIIEMSERHEASWNGQQYAMGNFKTLCHTLLQNEPKQTAMVMLLNAFAVQWSNDLVAFCQSVLENKHYS